MFSMTSRQRQRSGKFFHVSSGKEEATMQNDDEQRYRIALAKRAMERQLRAQGHSVGYARRVVAERFRDLGQVSKAHRGPGSAVGSSGAGCANASSRDGAQDKR